MKLLEKKLNQKFEDVSSRMLAYKRANPLGRFITQTILPKLPLWQSAHEKEPMRFADDQRTISRRQTSLLQAKLESAAVPPGIDGVFEQLEELATLAMNAGARDGFLQTRSAPTCSPRNLFEFDLIGARHAAKNDGALYNKFYEAAGRAVFAQQFEIETFEPHDTKIARYLSALRDSAILAYAVAVRQIVLA